MSNDFKVNRLKEGHSMEKNIHYDAVKAIWKSVGKIARGVHEFTGIDFQEDWDGKDFIVTVYDPDTQKQEEYTVDVKFRYTYYEDIMLCYKKTRGNKEKIGWAFNPEKQSDAILYIREKFNDAIWIWRKDLLDNRKKIMNEAKNKNLVKGNDDFGSYVQHNLIIRDEDLLDICPNTLKVKYA